MFPLVLGLGRSSAGLGFYKRPHNGNDPSFCSIFSTQPLVTLLLLQAIIDGMTYKLQVFIAPGESARQLLMEFTDKLTGKKDQSPKKGHSEHEWLVQEPEASACLQQCKPACWSSFWKQWTYSGLDRNGSSRLLCTYSHGQAEPTCPLLSFRGTLAHKLPSRVPD
jgi:hypothetical protein